MSCNPCDSLANEKTEVKSYAVHGRTRSQRKVFSVQQPPSPGETPGVQGHTTTEKEEGRPKSSRAGQAVVMWVSRSGFSAN